MIKIYVNCQTKRAGSIAVHKLVS